MEITEELLDDFRGYMKKQNLSPNTVTAYVGSVRLFLNMFDEVTPDNLRKYRTTLISRYKPATVNQRIFAVNYYIDFLVEHHLEDHLDLVDYHLTSVKIQKKSFQDAVISNEDYELLKCRLKEDGNEFWYFVVHFLASTGARVSELVKIKVEHLNHGYLDLYSKGGKIRRIYLPDTLCEEALDWCSRIGKKSGFLFTNKDGKPITTRGIHSQLKSFAVRYGIDPDTVYPHSFRHRYAKNFLERFNDISLLADLMGHENIETTRIYLKKSSREQQQLLDEIITW